MSNAMRFLEQLGQDARLRRASDTQLDGALQSTDLEPSVREAILARDAARLQPLLGIDSNICCIVYMPDPDEEGEKKRKDGPDPAHPHRDPEPARSRRYATSRAA
jgi:hypothetical protein